jgi:hypothetical protein
MAFNKMFLAMILAFSGQIAHAEKANFSDVKYGMPLSVELWAAQQNALQTVYESSDTTKPITDALLNELTMNLGTGDFVRVDVEISGPEVKHQAINQINRDLENLKFDLRQAEESIQLWSKDQIQINYSRGRQLYNGEVIGQNRSEKLIARANPEKVLSFEEQATSLKAKISEVEKQLGSLQTWQPDAQRESVIFPGTGDLGAAIQQAFKGRYYGFLPEGQSIIRVQRIPNQVYRQRPNNLMLRLGQAWGRLNGLSAEGSCSGLFNN